MSGPQLADVSIRVTPLPHADVVELESATVALRRHLLQFDEIEDVRRPADGVAPPGSKAADLMAAGSLVVSIVATTTHLRALINAARSALSEGRSVTLEMGGDSLTVTGIDSEEQQRLINLWLQRHQHEQ